MDLVHTLDCIVFDQIPVSSREPDGNGGVFASGTIARSGVQRYRANDIRLQDGSSAFPDKNANDIVLVNRPVEEVRKSAARFNHKGITVGHPDRNAYPKGVTADNYASLANGYVFDCKAEDTQDGGCIVRGKFHFTTKRAVDALDAGQEQVSAGYGHRLVVGQCKSHDGVICDAQMEAIEPNHVATVDFARGGPGCRVDDNQPQEGLMKVKLTVDGVDYQVEEGPEHSLINKLVGERDDARAKLTMAQTAHATAIKDMATAHDTALKAEQAKIPTPEAFRARVKLHSAVLALATGLLPKEAKTDDMDTEQLQRSVITAAGEKFPTVKAATTAVLAGTALDKADVDLLSRVYGTVEALLPKAGTPVTSRAHDEATARALAFGGKVDANAADSVDAKDVTDLSERAFRK